MQNLLCQFVEYIIIESKLQSTISITISLFLTFHGLGVLSVVLCCVHHFYPALSSQKFLQPPH